MTFNTTKYHIMKKEASLFLRVKVGNKSLSLFFKDLKRIKKMKRISTPPIPPFDEDSTVNGDKDDPQSTSNEN